MDSNEIGNYRVARRANVWQVEFRTGKTAFGGWESKGSGATAVAAILGARIPESVRKTMVAARSARREAK